MCTAVLRWDADGVLAVANRDERVDRAPEQPPTLRGEDPQRIGPRDGERGGTWCGANEHGLVALLLNGYGDTDDAVRADAPSRGEIVDAVLGFGPDAARRFLETSFDPAPYPSFTLVLASTRGAERWAWRREHGFAASALEPGWNVLTSSSWKRDAVCRWRHERFAEWCDAGAPMEGLLPAFNRLEVPGREEWSPWMQRATTETRSVTRLALRSDPASLRVDYWRREDAALDPSRPTAQASLALRRQVA